MAHKLGGHYKIPHGELISVFQVYSVQFVAKSCPRRYADMARAIGEKFDSDAEGATRFINDLRKLIETEGLPSSLRQLGIDENDFKIQTGESCGRDICRRFGDSDTKDA